MVPGMQNFCSMEKWAIKKGAGEVLLSPNSGRVTGN